MATTLPPIVHHSFGSYLEPQPHVFNSPSSPYANIENVSTTTLASAISINPRQTSTPSILSTSSTPLQPRNNEDCSGRGVHTAAQGRRSTSLHVPQHYACHSSGRPRKPPRSRVLTPCHNHDYSPTGLPRARRFRNINRLSTEESYEDESNTSKRLPRYLYQQLESTTSARINGYVNTETANNDIREAENDIDKNAIPFGHWADAFRRKKVAQPRITVRQNRDGQAFEAPGRDLKFRAQSPPTPHLGHLKRLSNSSSGFVETVKTASFSNASMSIGPRSHGLRRSDETRGDRSSNMKYSIDSDCPIGRPSLDEGALCRGLRRRQILREILISEESYIADLKALNNVFSTLLTSVASLSMPAKVNIRRNLFEILQLHMELSSELNRILGIDIFMCETPGSLLRKSGPSNYAKGKSSETTTLDGVKPQIRHARRSIDTVDSNALLRAAEPGEAADVARAFKRFMARFLIYEDYCSNYEVMLRELLNSQRSIQSWQLYETGIEALTRSIRAINSRRGSSKRAMTVGDLLMSPIQRLTKYPLLFADLHKSTPVIDCPDSHAEVDLILQQLRELVGTINHVTDNRIARERIRRRWLLQDRLAFDNETLKASQFRMLGHPVLCGVLHLAYQTKSQVSGSYGLCILFETHMVMAVPDKQAEKFKVIAAIHLSDLKTESASDGKGLQCHTALYSWKIVFEADQQLFEAILSACSAAEEEQWKFFMERRGEISSDGTAAYPVPSTEPVTSVSSDFKPVGVVFGQAGTLARRLSMQRAATVGNRTSICQVIIRNTHKPQDSHDSRDPSLASMHRSQSLLTTHKTVVLAPKRNERIRLEYALGDVWTRDKLPYPGMTTSPMRSGQIIRASAGSLVRKLSLASMHGPFARRSASLSTKSTETFLDIKTNFEVDPPKDSIVDGTKTLKETLEDSADAQGQTKGHGLGATREKQAFTGVDGLIRRGTNRLRRMSMATVDVPAVKEETSSRPVVVKEKLGGRKRWSNPLGVLKSFASEGVQHLLYSSR